MGNSQTKEARQPGASSSPRLNTHPGEASTAAARSERGVDQTISERAFLPSHSSGARRAGRADLSFLGLGSSNNEQDVSTLEVRRETKQEREARKVEKERMGRLKERERSMKEEHVDGGYLVTQGVYVGPEDYNKAIVRQLMIERRIAPFWRGLNEFSPSWAEHQLMAAARGMMIPPPDQVPPELEVQGKSEFSTEIQATGESMRGTTVPTDSTSQSYNSNTSLSLTSSFPPQSSPHGSPVPVPLFRTRAKTLASLTTTSKSQFQPEMAPQELQLPKDPTVNGQSIEVFMYKDPGECPICFLYYPPYLNTTRCCDQYICSECFVQIKRPDPHPPEHEQPDANAPPPSVADREAAAEGQLVSEVATCPFCKQPEFGITYCPPPFRRGLTYGGASQPFSLGSAMSSQTSLSSAGMTLNSARRRGTSLSATAPGVVTTDRVRPDWASKLASARAHAARRSAAATALHTAAYLMGGSSQSDQRGLAPFGRRNVLRRQTVEGSHPSSAQYDALSMLTERHHMRQQEVSESGGTSSSTFLPPPRGSSSRRNRMDELEDMMMMEAIRLSLAAEEDRRRKEEKEAKKEAKKKEKESKKAEKAGKRNTAYALGSSLKQTGSDGSSSSPLARVDSTSSFSYEEGGGTCGKGKGKGKGNRRPGGTPTGLTPSDACQHGNFTPSATASAGSHDLYSPLSTLAAESPRPSHLRQMSTGSSSSSSAMDPASGSSAGMTRSETPPGGGAGTEPMFNFRSLAAMIGDDAEEKEKEREKREGGDISSSQQAPSSYHTSEKA